MNTIVRTIPPWVNDDRSNRVNSGLINRISRELSEQSFQSVATNKSIPIVYGRSSVPANLLVYGTYQLSLQYWLMACAWCKGEVDAIEEIRVDGMTVDEWVASGFQRPGVFPSNPLVQADDSIGVNGIESFTGTPTQGIPFTLTRGGGNPQLFSFGDYTDTNPGVCYSCVQIDPRDALNKIPDFTAVIRGKKIYDPRDQSQTLGDKNTYLWSPNAALILADFIASYSEFDVSWDSVEDAADWCGQNVSTGVQASSQELLNYDPAIRRLIGFSISKPVQVEDFIRVLSEYAGCFVNRSSGSYELIADKPGSPVFHVTKDLIRGDPSIKINGNTTAPTVARVDYNEFIGGSDIKEFAETQAPPSGIVRRMSISMPFFKNKATALRHAVERLNKVNLTRVDLSLPVFDEGLKFLRGNIIEVSHPYGLDASEFRVIDVTSDDPGRWVLSCINYDERVYSDSVEPSPTYPDISPTNPDIPNDFTVREISPGYFAAGFWKARADGSVGPAMTLQASSFGVPYDLQDYRIQFRISKVEFDDQFNPQAGDEVYLSPLLSSNSHETDVLTNDMFDSIVSAVFQARLTRGAGQFGPWSPVEHILLGSTVDIRYNSEIQAIPDANVTRFSWAPAVPGAMGISYDFRRFTTPVVNPFENGVPLFTTESESGSVADFPSGDVTVAWRATEISTGRQLGVIPAVVNPNLAQSGAADGQMRVYRASEGREVYEDVQSGPQFSVKSGNQVISSTTPADITGLSFNVEADSFYAVEFYIAANDISGAGLTISLIRPSGTTFFWSLSSGVSRSDNGQIDLGINQVAAYNVIAMIDTGSNGGAVSIQIKKNGTSFQNPVILSDSWVRYQKM